MPANDPLWTTLDQLRQDPGLSQRVLAGLREIEDQPDIIVSAFRSTASVKCGVCRIGEPFMKCPDTGTILCMNCMSWPGQLGGIDHKLPNGNYCAHRPKNAVGGPATRIYTPH